MRITLIALVLLLSAPAAMAQTRPIAGEAEAAKWRAVGVVAVARQPVCTGTLIAPDLVLTAAHCVYSAGSGRLFPPELVEFRAGWRNGVSVARRQAARITAHRGYDPRGNYNARNIAVDVALIELATPVAAAQIVPMQVLNRLRRRERVDLVSYGEGRMDFPSIQEGCRLLDRSGDVLRLSCATVPGSSGAPVFTSVLGTPRIVSLISGAQSNRNGTQTALGVAFDRALAQLMSDRAALAGIGRASLPFWDSGRSVRTEPLPAPSRRIVRPGGVLDLPQNR